MSEKLGNICRAQSLRTSGSYSSSTRFPQKTQQASAICRARRPGSIPPEPALESPELMAAVELKLLPDPAPQINCALLCTTCNSHSWSVEYGNQYSKIQFICPSLWDTHAISLTPLREEARTSLSWSSSGSISAKPRLPEICTFSYFFPRGCCTQSCQQ